MENWNASLLSLLNFFSTEVGPQDWFFKDLEYLSQQQFEQKEPEKLQGYASNLSHWLDHYPPKDVLQADFVYSEWRPDVIRRALAYLVTDNLRVTVLTKKCRYFTDKQEKHYGTEYFTEKMSDTTLHSWKNCGTNPSHQLPERVIQSINCLAINTLHSTFLFRTTLLPDLSTW